jgi:hypothetical protein
MTRDPELGELASAVNAVETAFLLVQGPNRERWLRAIIRESCRVADVARAVLEKGGRP